MTADNGGTVYIETSVVSYLTARAPRDSMAAEWRAATVEWWDNHRSSYALVTSELTIDEARQGDPGASARRLAALQGIAVVPTTSAVDDLADVLIRERVVPEGSRSDAIHIAQAAINGIDYLLTWNFRHLTNARVRDLVGTVCERHGYTSPIICTPLDLLGGRSNG